MTSVRPSLLASQNVSHASMRGDGPCPAWKTAPIIKGRRTSEREFDFPEVLMPLSEHEQKILEEIERRLVADDPKFAREVGAGGAQGAALKRVKRAVFTFVLGFVLLIVGLFKANLLVYFGIVAFAVMVASAAVIASGIKQVSQHRGS